MDKSSCNLLQSVNAVMPVSEESLFGGWVKELLAESVM